jgi:hypothetical protein
MTDQFTRSTRFMPETRVSQMGYENVFSDCKLSKDAEKYFNAYGYSTDQIGLPFSFRIIHPDNLHEGVNLLGSGWHYPDHVHVLEFVKQLKEKKTLYPGKIITTNLLIPEHQGVLVDMHVKKELSIVMNVQGDMYIITKHVNYHTDAFLLVRY